jgi:hypothetical protein
VGQTGLRTVKTLTAERCLGGKELLQWNGNVYMYKEDVSNNMIDRSNSAKARLDLCSSKVD